MLDCILGCPFSLRQSADLRDFFSFFACSTACNGFVNTDGNGQPEAKLIDNKHLPKPSRSLR